jgi:hypothetical protein
MSIRGGGALRVPDAMPVLTRGKHKRPRNGACLMEYVSVLAGGPFTDSPQCTDPTLAAIARAVNDYSGDQRRQRLAVLASDLSVAGPLGLSAQHAMARRCLLTALPYSCGSRRRTLIVGLLGLERAAAGGTAGYCPDDVSLDSELALLGCDTDSREAIERLQLLPVDLKQHRKRGMAVAVEMAVMTIAEEAVDGDELLYRLLVSCLDDHRGTRSGAGVTQRDDTDRMAADRELAD